MERSDLLSQFIESLKEIERINPKLSFLIKEYGESGCIKLYKTHIKIEHTKLLWFVHSTLGVPNYTKYSIFDDKFLIIKELPNLDPDIKAIINKLLIDMEPDADNNYLYKIALISKKLQTG